MKKITSLVLAMVMILSTVIGAFPVQVKAASTSGINLIEQPQSGQPIGEEDKEKEEEPISVPDPEKEEETKVEEEKSSNETTGTTIKPATGGIDLVPKDKEEVDKSQYQTVTTREQLTNKASDLEDKYEDKDKVNIIVELQKSSLIEAGFSTSDISNGARTKMYAQSLTGQIQSMEKRISQNIAAGSKMEVLYRYTISMTGMAVRTEYENLEVIKELPGVKRAYISPVFQVCNTDLQPKTSNSKNMVGADRVWQRLGYTGKGTKIAVIDTGLDLGHPSFTSLSEDKITQDSLTKEKIQGVYSKLNAAKSNFGANSFYRSNKVPFAYNYITETLDVSHRTAGSDHGTHVAGIACGNKVNVSDAIGMAPDAQLIVMQVFGGRGADFVHILAAMEDAILLNVDAMNLSLGATAGFTDSDEAVASVLQRVSGTDMIVAIAAGNETDMGYNNTWGTNKSLITNPDSGVVGDPGTYTGASTVASFDNNLSNTFVFTVGGKQIPYSDTASSNDTNWNATLQHSNEYEFAWLGSSSNGASVDEFRAAKVEGKIALVSRGGGVPFKDMQANAKAAGAIACIIYNNVAGTNNMQISDGKGHIPCISISKSNGTYLIEQFNKGNKTLTTGDGSSVTITSEETVLSEFSSWGVTPSLRLKPDIAGVGGNVLSSRDNSTYGTMSGTSMASPQIAGVAALVLEYVHNALGNKNFTEKQMRDIANALMMSTASPIKEGNVTEYSPRRQGSGLVDAYSALTSPAYLTTDNQEMDRRPKIELLDDPDKDGVFTFTFDVNNLTNDNLIYDSIESVVLTEGITHDVNHNKDFISASPYKLSSEVTFDYPGALRYDFNEDGFVDTADLRVLRLVIAGKREFTAEQKKLADANGDGAITKEDEFLLRQFVAEFDTDINFEEKSFTVSPGGKTKVTANLTLNSKDKEYLEKFQNGMFVEGYVYVKDADGVNLSLPFMGFYGDWTKAPVFDSGDFHFWKTEGEYSQYFKAIFTKKFVLGVNPYIDVPYDKKHNAVSYENTIDEINIGLLRNAKDFNISIKDKETGTEYYNHSEEFVRKSYFNPNYGMILPYFIFNDDPMKPKLWATTDKNGGRVPNNTEVVMTVAATLDYDSQSKTKTQTWEVPIVVDTQKPELKNANAIKATVKENGEATIDLSLVDNQYIAAVLFVNENEKVMARLPVDNTPDKEATYKFDITGFGESFKIIVADYAQNEASYDVTVDLGEFGGTNLPIVTLDKNKLYAFETSESSKLQPGWFQVGKDSVVDAKNVTYDTSTQYLAGEYLDGYIIAQNTKREIVIVSPRASFWDEMVLKTYPSIQLYDMAYNYATDKLYAIGWDYSLAETGKTGYSVLVEIDIKTGELSKSKKITGMLSSETMITLGCTTEGVLYAIDDDAHLYSLNPEGNEAAVTSIGATGFENEPGYFGANTVQSMAYDHNTKQMFWAAFSYKYDYSIGKAIKTSRLYKVDLSNASLTLVGKINESAGTCLFSPYDSGKDLINIETKPESFALSQKNTTMIVGKTLALKVNWVPWSAKGEQITWESSDPAIATVSDKGLVKAIKGGTVTIKAKSNIYKNGQATPYEASCTIKIHEGVKDFYGCLLVDMEDFKKNNQTWVSFPGTNVDEEYKVLGAAGNYFAGTYYDGYVYASETDEQRNSSFYKIPVTQENGKTKFGTRELIQSNEKVNLTDMAMDYSTGRMYCIENNTMNLAIIDTETGDVDLVGEMGAIMVALACSTDGKLYGIGFHGELYSIDGETAKTTLLYNTGVEAGGAIQSMMFDHESGQLYWAQALGVGTAAMYMLTQEENVWKAIKVGVIGGKQGVEVSCLFNIPKKEPETTFIPIKSIALDDEYVTMIHGAQKKLGVKTDPERPTTRKKTWTSSDEKIATVDRYGNVKAVGTGETTITVSTTDRFDKKTYTDTLTLKVIPSGGPVKAYLKYDPKSGYMGWWSTIQDYDLKNYTATTNVNEQYTLRAGEYYDGMIYGYSESGGFYSIDESTHRYTVKESIENAKTIVDMAYNYKDSTMYALSDTGILYKVNLGSGALTKETELSGAKGLASGNELLYTYYQNKMQSYNPVTKAFTDLNYTDKCGAIGKITEIESMTYDYQVKRLYLSAKVEGEKMPSMYIVDWTEKAIYNIGIVGREGCNLRSMFVIPKTPPTETTVTGVKLNKEIGLVGLGKTTTLLASTMPKTATGTITWSSSDEAIATVANGVITGVKEGTVDITATCNGISSTCKLTVISDTTDEKNAYGFSGELGGLVKFDPDLPYDTVELVQGYERAGDVLASEYVNGTIYFLVNNYGFPGLYKMNVNGGTPTLIGTPEIHTTVNDMTYDAVKDRLFVTAGFYTYEIDKESGYTIQRDNPKWFSTMHGIAAINGYLYYVTFEGGNESALYRKSTDLNRPEVEYIGSIAPTETSRDSSMAIDHKTKTAYVTAGEVLYSIDILTGKTTRVDVVGSKDGEKKQIALKSLMFAADTSETGLFETNVTLNKNNITLYNGDGVQLFAKVYPELKELQEGLTWTSSNVAVADVDQTGKITTKTIGETKITVTTKRGLKAECTVKVIEKTEFTSTPLYGYDEDTLSFIKYDPKIPTLEGQVIGTLDLDQNIEGQIYPIGTSIVENKLYYLVETKPFITKLCSYDMTTKENADVSDLGAFKKMSYRDMTYNKEENKLYLATTVNTIEYDIATKVCRELGSSKNQGSSAIAYDNSTKVLYFYDQGNGFGTIDMSSGTKTYSNQNMEVPEDTYGRETSMACIEGKLYLQVRDKLLTISTQGIVDKTEVVGMGEIRAICS